MEYKPTAKQAIGLNSGSRRILPTNLVDCKLIGADISYHIQVADKIIYLSILVTACV